MKTLPCEDKLLSVNRQVQFQVNKTLNIHAHVYYVSKMLSVVAAFDMHLTVNFICQTFTICHLS